MFFSFLCSLCLCACLFICAFRSPAGKGLTSWLSFVVYNCEFVTFPLVSWVSCGLVDLPYQTLIRFTSIYVIIRFTLLDFNLIHHYISNNLIHNIRLYFNSSIYQ